MFASRRIAVVPLMVACACLAVSALAPRPAQAASLDGVPAFGHVFLIVGENTSVSEVTARHAPYITGTLRPRAAWLTPSVWCRGCET